jgi:histidyl-tRNA synthetase
MTIQPRTLRGFRDFLPSAMIPREKLMETARSVYRSYGFNPIDTPTLEYLEILSGKGSEETDRQMYHFEDQGGRKVGMRFDLTVPLARFAAQHIGKLGVPFKRYHIATVWRGENTQRGRYREFMQCDFDTIGSTAVAADIETVLVIHDLLLAIGIEAFTIRVNNRQVLNGLLEKIGLQDKSALILRALDKLGKIGPEKVAAEMVDAAGATDSQAQQVLKLSQLTGDSQSILADLKELVAGSETGMAGVDRLHALVQGASAAGVPVERLQLDVSIARGLDYYTGTIVETFLNDLPKIGSVCSGGRYDDLAELYTKQQLPGIGASLGLDRLLAAMEELNLIPAVSSAAEVFLPFFDRDRLNDYLKLAADLRRVGFRVEFYPEPKKVGQQLKYAGQRGFQVAVIAGEDEFNKGTCQIKNLEARTSEEVDMSKGLDHVATAIRSILEG